MDELRRYGLFIVTKYGLTMIDSKSSSATKRVVVIGLLLIPYNPLYILSTSLLCEMTSHGISNSFTILMYVL